MDITQALTGGGLILLLATIIGYLLNANWKDRQQHLEVVQDFDKRIEAMQIRHDEQIQRLEDRHSKQLEKLETRIDNLEREVDTERTQRQAAEAEKNRLQHRLFLLQGGDDAG